MLSLRSVCSGYGAAQVLFDASLDVAEGGVTCLLGHNGAGKSTLLRTVMGMIRRPSGSITFEGRELIGRRPFEIARAGIGYVPEDRRVFADLTVEENLDVATRRGPASDPWSIERAYEVFPALGEFRRRLAGRLSGGQQQMLTMARALMGNPRLVLLDEPTEGLSPVLVQTLEDLVLDLRRSQRLTILLACQDLAFAVRAADRIYVMDRGRITFETTAESVRADPSELRGCLAL